MLEFEKALDTCKAIKDDVERTKCMFDIPHKHEWRQKLDYGGDSERHEGYYCIHCLKEISPEELSRMKG